MFQSVASNVQRDSLKPFLAATAQEGLEQQQMDDGVSDRWRQFGYVESNRLLQNQLKMNNCVTANSVARRHHQSATLVCKTFQKSN